MIGYFALFYIKAHFTWVSNHSMAGGARRIAAAKETKQ